MSSKIFSVFSINGYGHFSEIFTHYSLKTCALLLSPPRSHLFLHLLPGEALNWPVILYFLTLKSKLLFIKFQLFMTPKASLETLKGDTMRRDGLSSLQT